MDLSAHVVIAGMVGYLIWRLSALVALPARVEPVTVATRPDGPVEMPMTHPTRTLRLCDASGAEKHEQVVHLAEIPKAVTYAGVRYVRSAVQDASGAVEYREA